jgi:hypothetical protein
MLPHSLPYSATRKIHRALSGNALQASSHPKPHASNLLSLDQCPVRAAA